MLPEIHTTTKRELPVDLLARTVSMVIEREGFKPGEVLGIYCGDRLSRSINRSYLSHDYPTDTITFCYEREPRIDGEFYISLDVIGRNARRFDVTFRDELLRVTIHSSLHLVGYEDATPEERERMTAREDYYLSAVYALSYE